jgi:polyisoprenoid-binding protein YceI
VTAKPSPRHAWAFDTHRGKIGFAVRHMVVSKAQGSFPRWTGKLDYDDADPEGSSAEVTIDAASIDTQDAARDAYLKSADFLDVAFFPNIVFKSQRVERTGRRLRVTGMLTIRNVSRAVSLDVTRTAPTASGERVRFTAETIVDRRAFGLRFGQVPDVGGVAVGNKIEVSIAVELVPADETLSGS